MKRPCSAEEIDLFRQAVRDVKPLVQDKPVVAPRRKAPRARFARAERRAVLEESLHATDVADIAVAPGDELLFRRTGVPDSIVRKLRRGEFRIQGEIDLHGMKVPEAKQALREYLADAVSFDTHCVRVVHGKGLGSGPRGPVLKNAVNSMLRRTDAVVAFVSARPQDGGTGALYVLLAR